MSSKKHWFDAEGFNDTCAQRDELIETQSAVIDDLLAQIEGFKHAVEGYEAVCAIYKTEVDVLETRIKSIKAHQATVRETTQEKYCAAIVRMARYRRLYRAARLKLAKRERPE